MNNKRPREDSDDEERSDSELQVHTLTLYTPSHTPYTHHSLIPYTIVTSSQVVVDDPDSPGMSSPIYDPPQLKRERQSTPSSTKSVSQQSYSHWFIVVE